MNNFFKAVILIGWFLGNMVIFSSVIYIKYSISGNSFDTLLLSIVMMFWVFGQIHYAKPNFEIKNEIKTIIRENGGSIIRRDTKRRRINK